MEDCEYLPKRTGPSNPNTIKLIRDLRKRGAKDKKHSFWTDLSKRLGKPRRQRPIVNLSKISRYAKEDELVVVPGKVLASGQLQGSYTIAALNFSLVAMKKIIQAGGKPISLRDLLELPASEIKKIRILA
ncbi:MAG: 50S ribosomal protein L18e [Candidatus Heimdallarchaeota archaeon]|nr:50S ribosomal protein L18e [Candidatus Heimdallarchaeota archaeon]